MKRRGVKDTASNRKILTELGYSYIVNEHRKRVFIKVTNSDFTIIKQLLDDNSTP